VKHTDVTRTTPTLEELLESARRRIQVLQEELDEAKARRGLIGSALLKEFPGSRIYVNGSVAHGDALTPLTDVDLGVVVAEAVHSHGPGKKGPGDLKDRAADAIRRELGPAYPKLTVIVEGRKRSILVRFGDPVTAGEKDFTADVIVAIDNLEAEGLYIPRYREWDRAHPEEHTRLVKNAIDKTDVLYARAVRLLKHWNRCNDMPMCSWNVKALALECLDGPMTQLQALKAWFGYAIDELSVAETEDPAHVAEKPIKLNKPRREVVAQLREAEAKLDQAIAFENANYPVLAWERLALMFNDENMMHKPDWYKVTAEQARKIADDKARQQRLTGTPALLTGVGAGAAQQRRDVSSWGL
jgi:acetolactate synthase small subunit